MAKRFTETGKWGEPWYYGLSPYAKLLFNYLCDSCDNAGFYELNEERLLLDTKIPPNEIAKCFEEISKSAILIDGRVWIKNFIKHQKNLTLNPKNNAHQQIRELLIDNGWRFLGCKDFLLFLETVPKELQEQIRRFEGLNSPPGIVRYSNGIGIGKVDSFESAENFSLPEEKFSIDEQENKILKSYADIIPVDKSPTRKQLSEIKSMRIDFGDQTLLEAIAQASREGRWRPERVREIAFEVQRENNKRRYAQRGETLSMAEIIKK